MKLKSIKYEYNNININANDKKIFKLGKIYNIFCHRKSRNSFISQGIPTLLCISSVENGILYQKEIENAIEEMVK